MTNERKDDEKKEYDVSELMEIEDLINPDEMEANMYQDYIEESPKPDDDMIRLAYNQLSPGAKKIVDEDARL